MIHSCHIECRDYTKWTYNPCNSDLLNPIEYKLFNGDEFLVDGTTFTGIVHSTVRTKKDIPGILLLENNTTFGRTPNKKRLYYKCKPYDATLPIFLIPYDMPIWFNKNFKNKYVTFSFNKWVDKHPVAILTQSLGDVFDFPSYCEYSLYCKGLHLSILESINKTKRCMAHKTIEEHKNTILNNPDTYGEFIQRKNEHIFTIDPTGCADRDDAISICYASTTSGCRQYKVSVYIANVWVWLGLFDLWENTGNRVSTIYFPNMKRPMLPTSISEKLCSLDADGCTRFCFVMDFNVFENTAKNDIQIIGSPTFKQCSINVVNNFDYEETKLLGNRDYQLLKNITHKLDNSVSDSHDTVAYWMTQMNFYCAKLMKQNKFGIFRTVQQKSNRQNGSNIIPSDMPYFIRILEQQVTGKYKLFQENTDFSHETLGLSEYIHITSPIRRMVDLLNQIKWVIEIISPPLLSEAVTHFYNTQVKEIDGLNSKMNKTRKIQSDCDILFKSMFWENLTETIYDGIVIGKSHSVNKCTIYIDKLKWMAEVNTTSESEHNKFDRVKCRLFMFENEENMKRKIRLQII